MILDYEVFRPIRAFGQYVGLIGTIGIICHIAVLGAPQYTRVFQVFVVIISVFCIVISWNIVRRNRWGFKSLKLILYLLYLVYPLGYYFSKRTFQYIEYNNIEKYFDKSLEI